VGESTNVIDEDKDFPPTRDAALLRVYAIQPSSYARSRNSLDGAVTRLSPYLSHGFISLPQAYAAIAARHEIDPQHKLVYEFGWREYWHHVWAHRGGGIFESLHQGLLPEDAYATELPGDIREARTGVRVIDRAVRELYATGYLHNHVRMWLASYVVHLRKVHWRAGADWLYAHLLDGDLASNHLSWQWVAATASQKPYLFNAENVARYAPAEWHSTGTSIDTTYEALDRVARSHESIPPGVTVEGRIEPALLPRPPRETGFDVPDSTVVTGRDVWLVHPWALNELPDDLPAETLVIAIAAKEWHVEWPWSARRWQFVTTRQRELAALRWFGDIQALRTALAYAGTIRAIDDPHYGKTLRQLRDDVQLARAPKLFAPVNDLCDSFTQWWQRTRLT